MSNRQLDDAQEEAADRKLASILGISYEELSLLTWDTDNNESNDGLVYEIIVRFSDDSPRDILDKIGGLEDGYCVRVDPSEFAEPDPDDL
ncbi:TPA: hypothetical protein ACVO0U_003061 [Vibrio alginolyticus]